jgi:hypothetical protein
MAILLKAIYRFKAIQMAWYWYSYRQVEQWNRIEVTEMNPHTYGHLTLTRELKPSSGKKTASSRNGAGSTGRYHVEEWELIHSSLLIQSSSLSAQINST